MARPPAPGDSCSVTERLTGLPGVAVEPVAGDAHLAAADDLERFLDVAEQLASGIAALHAAGVRHGGIRPEHVVVRDGRILLTGFERASTLPEERPEASPVPPDSVAATFLAPEQTGRLNRMVDERADLHALGATLYALATGRPPFAGQSGLDLVRRLLAESPQPPAERAAWMPAVLSDLLLKLLAKEPADRYQTAAAVAADLRHFRAAAAAGTAWSDIQPVAADRPARPLRPRPLRGRDAPLAELRAALESVGRGGSQTLFLTGRPGVGKTALAEELRAATTLAGGLFVEGKCEQFRGQRPLLAPARALRQICRLVVTESASVAADLGRKLRATLGPDAALLLELVPEAAALLGRQPAASEGTPGETEARLRHVCVEFLRTVASPDRPVVMVFDDMQWADQPSLDLVRDLMQADRLSGLLVIGTFRSGLDPSHPLERLLDLAATGFSRPQVITLRDLPTEDLHQVVGEMLAAEPGELAPLTTALHAATGGNPFFTVKLIRLLHQSGSLRRSPVSGAWSWADAVKQIRGVEADVASLAARIVADLPADATEPLAAAACLGSECTLGLLAEATGRTREELIARLWPAFIHGVLVTPDATTLARAAAEAPIRFRHDHLQRAAHALGDEAWRTNLRLSLARNLAKTAADEQARYQAASHYAAAAKLIASPEETRTARELFLAAARSARQAGGFADAANFLTLARQLLPPDPWTAAPAAAWDILRELHVVRYSLSDHAEADRIWEELAGHAPSPAALAEPACVQVMSLSNRTRYDDALDLGTGILVRLGITVPRDQFDHWLEQEVTAFGQEVAAGALDHLPRRPAVSVAAADPAAKLMNRMVPAAFFTRPAVANWLVMTAARRLVGGVYDDALLYPMACTCLALVPVRGDYQTGPQASRAALAIGIAAERGVETARVRHVHGLLNIHWCAPLEEALPEAREAFDSLMRHGEFEFACYTFFTSQTAILETSAALAELAAENRRGLDFALQTGNRHAAGSYDAFRWLVAALADPEDAASIADPDEGNALEHLAANPMARAFHHIYAGVAAAILGDEDRLTAHAAAAAPLVSYITSFYPVALANVLDSLATIAALRAGAGGEAAHAKLAANQAWLAARAGEAPTNFSHLHDLVEAESLLATGRGHEALAGFERAMRRAAAHRRPWHLALITERAARCYLALDLEQAGRRLLDEARRLYGTWGAGRKVARLEEEFPFLRRAAGQGRGLAGSAPDDETTLFTMAQSLAAARSLPALVEQTMAVLKGVSAASDVLVLAREQGDRWSLLGGELQGGLLPSQPLEDALSAGLVPRSVLQLGLRLRQSVMADDAMVDAAFTADPHFAGLEVCAVLGVPVLARGEPVAFVVLENRHIRAAFGPGLTAAVELLCGQLAVALENTRLNEVLETEVRARTAALREAERTLAQVAYEMTENIPVGTYIFEHDETAGPRFTFVSEQWLRMLDLKRADVLADPTLAFQAVHPEERAAFNALNATAIAERRRFAWEGRILVRGVTRWVSIASMPRERPAGGTIWEGVMIDVTQRVEAVEALAQSQIRHRRQLEEKLKTSLEAAAVAHEIKQPLSRVLLQARLAEREPAGHSAALAAIAAEARTVERTIEKMRVLLRSVETSHAPVDLRDVVTSSLLQVKWQLAEHGIEVVQRGFTRPALIDGDDAQLQLAVTNLLRNAAEAIVAADRPLRRIALGLRRGHRQVVLAIGDSGPGWSGAERRELPFSTTKPAGSGIGLYLVRTIAQHHAGEVGFHRSADGGAEVRLRFPLAAVG
ncbi:MAG: AAA family ATPase [Planctomycetota bacterium]